VCRGVLADYGVDEDQGDEDEDDCEYRQDGATISGPVLKRRLRFVLGLAAEEARSREEKDGRAEHR
jgi:hypothetical protein